MIKEQIIDVTRSYLVTDPEAFYENLMVPVREDSPEKMLPVVAFEGYNFLPTLYGYRSYFDTASKLDIGTLSSRCDRILLYQFANYQNILVALCEDGIWTNSGGSTAEAWNHRITLSAPGVGLYLEWTFCVIENTLYMYRQGNSVVYTITQTSYGLGNPVQSITPSFLNMTGQMGIFRANGRLGFWDSANSVSWSSLFSFIDFTPSLETLAGFATFNDVLGRIVTIKASGSGFIIYSTKNIVGVSYNDTGSVLFSAKTIAEIAGIWTSKQVCTGAVDTEQFAYTNTGIKHISQGFKIEDIFPGVYDFLKESREPVYLDFLNGRYLFLSLINPDYISGKVIFKISTLDSMTVRFLYNGAEVTDAEDLPSEVDGLTLVEALARDLIAGPGITGLYAQWAASGSKLVPGRVSSMEPYQLDDPFTPDDDYPYARNTTPLYSTAELIDARDNGIWTDKFSMYTTPPLSLDLGWHNAPLGLNRTDSGLTRMKLRQKEEWDEYIALAADVQSEIVTLGSANSLVLGDVIYGGGGPLLATDTGWVSIGDLTTGDDSSAPIETFGTGSYEYKKSFSKKAAIERRVEVVDDSEPQVTVPHIHWYSPSGTAYDFGYGLRTDLWIHNCATTVIPTRVYEPAMPTGTWEYYRPTGYEQSESERAAVFAAIKVFAASWFTPPATLPTRNFDHAVITEDANTYKVEYYYKNIHNVITHEFTLVAHYEGSFEYTGIHRKYGIQTKSLRTGSTTASGSDFSILSGTQEYVDWGLWLEDAPDPDFPYDTNSLDLGSVEGFDLSSVFPNSITVTYPGATFLLQNATTAPIYPDFSGAIVYDIFLQKWGKAKASYRCLMDYSPINSNVEQVVDYTNFGLTAGILTSGGFLKLFSANCTDSFIRYGKLAFSRLGYTYPEELVVNFRMPFTGSIQTDVSMDGRSLHGALTEETTFTGVGVAKVYPSYSGQWHTISVKGLFDIRSMSYTGRVSGIR